MPFRNGLYVRLQSWVARAAAGAPISAVEFDADENDEASALSNCILRDGTGAPTADTPWGGKGVTSMRQAAAAGEAVEYGQWQASLATRIPGEMIDFGGSVAPSKWLMCDGRAVSRTTYALLFAAIGTAFGVGDGSTTFNLPDARGRATFGVDTMSGTGATSSTAAGRITKAISGVDGTALGAAGGDQRMHAHSHATTAATTNVITSNPFGSSSTGSGGSGIGTYDLSGSATGATGAGTSQNMPPALVVAKIIYAGA